MEIEVNEKTIDSGFYKSYEDYNNYYFELIHTERKTQKDYIRGIYAMSMFLLDLYAVCDNWKHYEPTWYSEIEMLMNDLKGRCVNHIKYLEKFINYDSEVIINENV